MSRVKRGVRAKKRKKNIFKRSKGFTGSNKNVFLRAKQVVERALAFATRDRKVRKRVMRKLWISRINAACRAHGLKYSEFIHALKLAKIKLNRKMLADLAVTEPKVFESLIKSSQKA